MGPTAVRARQMSETRGAVDTRGVLAVSGSPEAAPEWGEGAGPAAAQAFRDLARDQLPRLYSIARRLVGDDAEDAVQDCLLKAFQRYGQLKDDAAGPAWLVSILVNC